MAGATVLLLPDNFDECIKVFVSVGDGFLGAALSLGKASHGNSQLRHVVRQFLIGFDSHATLSTPGSNE